jgi:RIO-like serine/threonine protein kinase
MAIQLTGNSGCKLELTVNNNVPVIIKSNGSQLDLDYAVLQTLAKLQIKIPDYYFISPTRVVMRYLDGLSMADYIQQDKDIHKLIEFLSTILHTFEKQSIVTDIRLHIQEKFEQLERCKLPGLLFKLHELYDQLPTHVPCGIYHGDLTLENIIYWNDNFYLIDANHTNLNSVAFDSAKIRQDTECLWFTRNVTIHSDVADKINYINSAVKDINSYTSNNFLLIFMLLRVIPYCTSMKDRNFLIMQINQLWI